MIRTIAAAALLAVMSALGACAAYEKCGFGGCPGDAAITGGVQAAFLEHPELQPPNLLKVQTVDGVVYLYGLVDTDLQRQMAQIVALQAPGVARVVNSVGLSGNSR